MFPSNFIYKVNYLKDNKITSIHVFYGEPEEQDVSLSELFESDPTNALFQDKASGQPIFNREELDYIKEKTIPVHFSKQQIHYDDSIGTIKLKIISEFSNTFSLEELYLFCLKEETFSPDSVYQTLTQNKKLPLTRVRLYQFLSNLIRNEQGEPVNFQIPEKSVYDYEDILALHLSDYKFWVSKVLGQKFFLVSNEYPYVYNPYDVQQYDEFIERVARKSMTTLNSHLLLNTGNIVENNIYICLAEDVLEYAESQDLSSETTIKLYYPFLYKQNIISLSALREKKYELIERNRPLLTPEMTTNFQAVDLFYDMYKERTSELQYHYRGVKYIKIIMYPEIAVKMPLDIIFKLIHAKEQNPMIKYNPSTRQENIYRLFTDQLARDGRKIPFLNKATIFKWMKQMGRTRSVSVYIEHDAVDAKEKEVILCEFEENGNISISCEFQKIMNLSEIATIFQSAVNPILEEVKTYFEENGYSISLLNSLFQENVEVKQINYQTMVEIEKTLDIADFIGCLTSVFIVEKVEDTGKKIDMRYKRVANFNKKTSEEAFVIEQANQKNGLRGEELLQALVANYQMTTESARELLAKMVNELQVERGVRRNDIEIKINPGFKTRITVNPITGLALIEMDNINDIQYLSVIPIYLDSFLRLTQRRDSSRVPIAKIDSLCGLEERKEIPITDIISASEVVFPEQDEEDDSELRKAMSSESVSSGPEIILEESMERPTKNVLDLLFDEDEDEEDSSSSEQQGGKTSSERTKSSASMSASESESSVPSELISGEIQGLEQLSSKSVSEPSSSNEITVDMNEEPILVPVSRNAPKTEPMLPKPRENAVRNLDGMKLANPTPFFKSMEERDPVLFLRENSGKFNAYSRTCPAGNRRQPIILTDEELQKIEMKMPGFLKEGDILKYGSNPEKQFNYICPRYWCLKTNMPIDPSEIVDGKHPTCGKVIPRDAKVVPKGAYIYEFFSPPAHGTRENYKEHKPGFVADGKHPDGYCIPCCFSNWDKPAQIKRRRECAQALTKKQLESKSQKLEKTKETEEIAIVESDSEEEEDLPEKAQQYVREKEEYVKGPEKFPLDAGRWGYLPIPIQIVLRESNADCQISKTNANIKPFHNCLLRHGVQTSKNQSFIACIADAKFFGEAIVPSIEKMKEIIISSLTIDNYITFQNGNLILSFLPEKEKEIDKMEIDISPYQTSKLYSKIDPQNPDQLLYFQKIVASFQNFLAFLRDPKSILDYTYLWDIVCRPNPAIFSQGINLVILEIPEDDITNNVELICPTNHYSNEYYNARKQTLILMHKGDFFEPLYMYRNEETKLKVSKTFSEYDPQLSKTMHAVFKQLIKPLLYNMCVPLASMPTVYKFKRPILLEDLIFLLQKYNYETVMQVVNYSSKVIGIIAENMLTGERGMIPCYPTEIRTQYDYLWMTEDAIYKGYLSTVQFLEQLYKESRGKIPCKPEFKVMEDEHIIGILTETNQFIQVNDLLPASTVNDSLKPLEDANHLLADAKTTITDKVDEERVKYIQKIKLETQFFQAFRNTIRLLLNDYENLDLREKIEQEMNASYILYSSKLNYLIENLKTLVGNAVIFAEDVDSNLTETISTCLVTPLDKCEEKSSVCVVAADQEQQRCQLVIPKNNLITGKNNETYYFGRIADEIIRYSRVKAYLFEPDNHLSFGMVNYNLREDEILLIQSMLTQEYFQGLEPISVNPYANYNTYDIAEPKISQLYENTATLDGLVPSLAIAEAKEIRDCIVKTNMKISSGIWKKCFPDSYQEIEYEKSSACGFYLLIDIVKHVYPDVNLTPAIIRQELLEEYRKYLPLYENQILDILILEGKKTWGDQVKAKALSFSTLFLTEGYFITTLDIWILMEKYKIPTIFISSKPILQSRGNYTSWVAYGNRGDRFIFLVLPGLRAENIPKFKIIQSPDTEITFPISVLQTADCIQQMERTIKEHVSLEEYLKNFNKKEAKPKKAKLVLKESLAQEPPLESKPTVTKNKKRRLILQESGPEPEAFPQKPVVPEPFVPNPNPNPKQTPKPKTKRTSVVVPLKATRKNRVLLKIVK